MLYKKYHRNFIKQFKKGTKFEYCHEYCHGRPETKDHIVEREPYYDRIFKAIRMISDKGCWNLVFPEGQLNKHLHVV